jgi:hypothetical protein
MQFETVSHFYGLLNPNHLAFLHDDLVVLDG